MQDLRITLVQADLLWQDAAGNRLALEQLLAPLAGQTDLIVLPEMFTTGFSMAPEKTAEPADGPTVDWMRRWADRTGAAITGSVATEDGQRYYNRLLWVKAEGGVAHYDKRHLFRMAHEQEHYTAGSERLIVELNGWRIRPLICYDLRFPVWSRNAGVPSDRYDLLIYVANWPEVRRHAWKSLLPARAIENLSYCVGVNRVGTDGVNVAYGGDSMAVDFMGRVIAASAEGQCVSTVALDRAALEQFRRRFPAHLDADGFDLSP